MLELLLLYAGYYSIQERKLLALLYQMLLKVRPHLNCGACAYVLRYLLHILSPILIQALNEKTVFIICPWVLDLLRSIGGAVRNFSDHSLSQLGLLGMRTSLSIFRKPLLRGWLLNLMLAYYVFGTLDKVK